MSSIKTFLWNKEGNYSSYSCHTVMSVGGGIVNWSILMPSKRLNLKINVTLFLSFELVPELSRPDSLALL